MTTTLAILKPGKYLMLNRNHYVRLREEASVLILEDKSKASGDDRSTVVLHGNDLILVNRNEYKIQ